MKRLRICQLITELHPAGAERCVFELARRLDPNRFSVHIAALRGGAVADWLERAGIGVTVLNVRGKLDITALARLASLLKRERFDLLHTHLFHADLAGRIAAGMTGVANLVHTVHVAEARFKPWRYAWAYMTANRCDRIVCVSQAVRDHHARKSHLPLWRYEVIYNGIDADAYSPNLQRREELRHRWGVGGNEILIAFVGRLVFQKNLPMLLEAIGRLRSNRSDIHLVVAGDGPEAAVLEKVLSEDESGLTIWLGQTDDVAGVLAAADVFALPSRWEGFGLAAAEAMAAGLPVIGTKVPGLTELIEDGVSGLLIDSEDTDALMAVINRLADDRDERMRLGSAAQQRVRDNFSIEANVTAHERLYESVCSE
ncbi:MAG: glycosyltransferase [Planctomycetota bacterium]|nr:glycosyltransferase [Planctomycetota bacterium]